MTTAITLHEGDNRDTLRRLIDQGVQVHSIVTDSPYGMTSVTRRFGADRAAPAKFGRDGAFQRASAGFMGSKWDGTGIERDPEFWALIYDILLPGGYCVAFSAARTGHWQACAMELAGFVMHPFLGWVYGSGFPKAHNASKAIDRELGAARERIPVERTPGWQRNIGNTRPYMSNPDHTTVSDVAATAAAAAWDGWAYGGQALKPALEPIYVGQKPFSEKNGALNLLKHGVGAINIDGCRVAVDPASDGSQLRTMDRSGKSRDDGWGMDRADATISVIRPEGRHPANLLHDGSDAVRGLFPTTPGQIARSSSSSRKNQNVYGEMRRGAPGSEMDPRSEADTSAARFFNAFAPSDADYAAMLSDGAIAELEAEVIRYQAKAGKADRAGSRHPTVKPIALMQWLCRLVTPSGGLVLDPFAGSGTTAQAARNEGFDCILMEAEPQFASDIRARFALPAAGKVEDFSYRTKKHFPTGSESAMRTETEQVSDFDGLVDSHEQDEFTALL